MRRRAWLARIFLLATAAPVAMTFAAPISAQAASTCPANGVAKSDSRGIQYSTEYICSTYVSTPVYWNVANRWSAAPLDDNGYMYASASVWVLCQVQERANPTISGNTNTWWLWAQGDVSRSNNAHAVDDNTTIYDHAWGFLPETAVRQGGSNQMIANIPVCPFVGPLENEDGD